MIILSSQQVQDFHLGRVGILVFVHQDVGKRLPVAVASVLVGFQQAVGFHQKVMKVQQQTLAFFFLISPVNTGYDLHDLVFLMQCADLLRIHQVVLGKADFTKGEPGGDIVDSKFLDHLAYEINLALAVKHPEHPAFLFQQLVAKRMNGG